MKATIKQNTIYRSSTYRFIPDIDIFIQILMMVPHLGNPSNNQEIRSRNTRVPRTDLLDSKEYCPPLPPPTADEFESLITSPEPVETSTRKNKNENKRRFTDEQVKLLESMFETETKLEPRKKVLLARELGMQPRQVAIWFQNKRARWRSKHVEKEYTILKADYDDLKYRYESLKKEKQSLLMQMQTLSDMLQQPHDRSKSIEHLAGNSTDGNSENGDNNGEYEANPCRSEEGFMNKKVFMGLEEDRIRNNIRNPGFEEGHGIKNKGEQVDGSSASPEKWRRVVDACGVYDQPCSDSQWWEFWT